MFVRGGDQLILVEFQNDSEPIIMQNGVEVNVKDIGYRNSQIQHDKLKGD